MTNWRFDAACKSTDTELFFADSDQDAIRRAKGLCAGCPVRKACLEFAIEARVDDGIFGGKTARQRKRIRVGS
jgi:WhiB family redox-sensing transcriptional regulator